MRKIILTLSLVFAAMITNAATFNWTINKIGLTTPESTAISSTAVTAYLFGDYTSQTDAQAALSSASSALAKGDIDSLTSSGWKHSKTGTASVGVNGNQIKDTYSNSASADGATYWYYSLLVATVDGTQYYILTGLDDARAVSPTVDDIKFSAKGLAWTKVNGGGTDGNVPEPTSGLLLLVGGALLALRRKRK